MKGKKITLEEFIIRAKNINDNSSKFSYHLIEQLIPNQKVKIFCNFCNNFFLQDPFRHLKGQGCKRCKDRSKTKTKEQFLSELSNDHKLKYDYSETIIVNKRTKIKILCKSCKFFFHQFPGAHIKGNGCINCSNKKQRKPLEKFILEAIEIHGNKYNYDKFACVGSSVKSEIFCNTCKKYFWMSPTAHVAYKEGCKTCGYKRAKKLNSSNKSEFIEKATNIFGNLYNYDLFEYTTTKIKSKILCNNCNLIFEQSAFNHLAGSGCLICYGKLVYDKDSFIKKAKELHNDLYNYNLFEYLNKKNKSKIICNKCHNIFLQSSQNHLKCIGCPICKNTNEKLVHNFLIKNSIIFEPQKKIKYNDKLMFADFFIESENLIIEYNGAQHYKPVNFNGCSNDQAIENLKKQQYRDNLMREYCKVNNINILEIDGRKYKGKKLLQYLNILSTNKYSAY